MRKLILVILLIILVVGTFFFYVAKEKDDQNENEIVENVIENTTENVIENTLDEVENILPENIIENKVDEKVVETNKKVILEVNGNSVEVTLENNNASNELYEKIKNEGLTLRVRDYGGFEKVGALGFPLTREDKEIETYPGDLVLYNGSQLSIFYKPHSWSYTKLGHFDIENVEEFLGKGEVELKFKAVESEIKTDFEETVENVVE